MNSSTCGGITWGCAVLSAIVAWRPAHAQDCGEANLIPPGNMLDAGDQYGWSVAIDGNVAVVGARLDDDNGFEAGAAYVYQFDGTTWQYVQKLTASDGGTLELFGSAVDVSGDVIVIGAWQNTTTGSGAAYVYHFNPGTMLWEEQQKLTAGPGAMNDDFGWSVAVDGDWIVIGARTDDSVGTDAGALHVFNFDEGFNQWLDIQKLTASDADGGDLFGWSVDMDGDTIVTGVPFDKEAGVDAGSVYVFRIDGKSGFWIETQKLLPFDGDGVTAGDLFGWSVALGETRLAIGAPGDGESGTDSGAVYRSTYIGFSQSWGTPFKLPASPFGSGAQLGTSVAVIGEQIVAGAPTAMDGGAAVVYSATSSICHTATPSSRGATQSAFGQSIAGAKGEFLVVGAPMQSNDAPSDGSALAVWVAAAPHTYAFWTGTSVGDLDDPANWTAGVTPWCGTGLSYHAATSDVTTHVVHDAEAHGLYVIGGLTTTIDLDTATLSLHGTCSPLSEFPPTWDHNSLFVTGLRDDEDPFLGCSPPLTTLTLANGQVNAAGTVTVGVECGPITALPGLLGPQTPTQAQLRLENAVLTSASVSLGVCPISSCASASSIHLDANSILATPVLFINVFGSMHVEGGAADATQCTIQGSLIADQGATINAEQFHLRDNQLTADGEQTVCTFDDLIVGMNVIWPTHCSGGPVPGSGRLFVLGGASVAVNEATVALELEHPTCGANSGLAHVAGAGSTLTIGGSLYVGQGASSIGNVYGGRGNLEVMEGGYAQSGNAVVRADFPQAAGGYVCALVDGQGSVWQNTGLIDLGSNTVLEVGNGGQVMTGSLLCDPDSGINIRAQSTEGAAGALMPIEVNGSAQLAGTLRLCWATGERPNVDDVIMLLIAEEVTGSFATEIVPAGVQIVYDETSVRALVVAPQCLADIVDSATFQCPSDGVTDGADLAFLLGEWGDNPGSLADLVSSATFQPPPDGVVDGADLAYLLGAWGTCN